MKSNVRVKSNVYLRQGVELIRDRSFLQQIRGRGALVKFLRRFSPADDPTVSTRKLLNHRQVAELAWEQRCDICGAVPEGPVTRNGVEQIEFRCPRGRCKTQAFRHKLVLLDLKLIDEATTRLNTTAAEVVRLALERFRPTPGSQTLTAARGVTRPFPLKLTPYEFYFLSSEEIELSLLSLLAGESCQK